MSDIEELRALVREVIRDVLPQGLRVTETVNLSTDEDLASFVKQLLDLDPDQRDELRSGRKRFRLAGGAVNGAERAGESTPARRIERGAVTEAMIDQAAATEPWVTSTRSPTPLPSTSKAIIRWPVPSASTSRNAPLGSSASRRVAQTLPITVAVSISAPSRSARRWPGPDPGLAG